MNANKHRDGDIGAKIKRARTAAGISQRELAKTLDVSPAAIGQWEGGYTRPARENLRSVAIALGLTLEDLLGATRDQPVGGAPADAEAAISLDPQLLDQAREAGIDVAASLNAFLREQISKGRADRWLKENREALDDANAFLARHGLWSDGKRQF
jgi:antitoxin CcdA